MAGLVLRGTVAWGVLIMEQESGHPPNSGAAEIPRAPTRMRERSAETSRYGMIFDRHTDNTQFPAASAADRRAIALRDEEERALAREKKLATQTSPLNDPQERIRIWEQLHALRLPLTEGHKLLGVIAAQTELTLSQVREEQQRRATPLSAPPRS
jgi:hypothetical protein